MTVLWTNDAVIFKDGDVVWKPHETDVQATCIGASDVDGVLSVTTELGSSITEISGVGGALGLLEVATELIGALTSGSGADGILTGIWTCRGALTSGSGAGGILTGIWTCRGALTEGSGADGSLDSQNGLGSAITEISGASGSLGVLEVATELQGDLTSGSGADGHIELIRELIGALTEGSGADGSLSVATELIGDSTSGSGADGSLDSQNGLGSAITEISGTGGALGLLEVATELIGALTSGSGTDGILTGIWTCRGVLTSGSGVDGHIELIRELIGALTSGSGADGSLNSQNGLGSAITEISGASGSLGALEVATELIGALTSGSGVDGHIELIRELIGALTEGSGADGHIELIRELIGALTEGSDADGSLSVATELIGDLTSGSGADGFLNILRGLSSLYGDLTASSNVFGYLTITPDFEAATLFWRPENNILETLEWKTSILKAHDGTEQRIKIRQSPRQYFKLELMLKTNEANTWFDSVIHAWQKLAWLIPIWSEFVKHTTDIDIKDDLIVVDTTNADFRNSNKAIIWKSPTEYEVIVIDTKIDAQLNLSYSVLNSFIGDKYIIPVRTAYLVSSSKKERSNSEISIISLIFAVYDNVDIENYVPEFVYDGYEVLNVPAFMDIIHQENSDADIFITDFETGIFKVESNSDFNLLTQNHNFFNDTKEACWDFRKFLYSLNGRQKVILIPTFRSDVVQTDNVGKGDTSVKIENIKLAENMSFNSLRTYIGFYFPNGTLVIRKITGITELDSSEEQIDFNLNLDLGLVIESGDCKICFVDKCRLASDRIQIQWPYAHRNECRTDFVRVP